MVLNNELCTVNITTQLTNKDSINAKYYYPANYPDSAPLLQDTNKIITVRANHSCLKLPHILISQQYMTKNQKLNYIGALTTIITHTHTHTHTHTYWSLKLNTNY